MRVINRVLAALLSLALIIVGALLIIEVITHWFSSQPAIVHWHDSYSWAKRTAWNQGSIRVVCIVLAVLGLALLSAQLKPSRVSRLAADPDQTETEGIDTGYTRRGAAAAIRTSAAGIDGVRGAKVEVGRRKVTVTAATSARDKVSAQALREPIAAAVQEKLDRLKLRSVPSVSVHVQPRSS